LHTYPLPAACPGVADSPARQIMCEIRDAWRSRLPREHDAFGGWLQDQDVPTLLSLMLADAEQLLAGTGCLPSLLRRSEPTATVDSGDADSLTTPSMPIAAE
jgi:hypothetical protein